MTQANIALIVAMLSTFIKYNKKDNFHNKRTKPIDIKIMWRNKNLFIIVNNCTLYFLSNNHLKTTFLVINLYKFENRCRINVDIMTGKKLVALSPVIYWSVRFSSRRGGFGVKLVGVIGRFLACYKFSFIREHDNLV